MEVISVGFFRNDINLLKTKLEYVLPQTMFTSEDNIILEMFSGKQCSGLDDFLFLTSGPS